MTQVLSNLSYLAAELHDESIQKELQKLRDNFNDETQWYHEQRRKLEAEYQERLRPLHERQGDLARMLNSKQALTKDLPPETMALIFREACARRGSEVLLTKIGRVSAEWRQIAWSTPQLWTRMDMNVSFNTLTYTLLFLRLHLNNVKGLFLSLRLQFSQPWSYDVKLLDALVKLLSDRGNARKIRSLSLNGLPQQLAPLLSNGLGCFSHLEVLDIGGYKPMELSLVGLSCLRNVTLCGVNLVAAESSFPTVTSLKISGLPINTVFQLFLRCPNLTSVTADTIGSVTSMNWAEITEIITFHCLERITWAFDSDPTPLSLFRRIHTPCLRSLDCKYDRDAVLEESALLSFANTFPSTLTQLTLRLLTSLPLGFFERAFARTSRLESLDIEDRGSAIMNIISVLRSGPGPESLFLPFLKELTITDCGWPGDPRFGNEFLWGICGLLERRWRSGVSHFIVRLDIPGIDWDPRSQQEISSVVEAGFNLKIYEYGKVPSWLNLKR